MNFLHNDIKSENILVGQQGTGLVYLIDFGLATPYMGPNGKHLPETALTKFSGNFMFASMN